MWTLDEADRRILRELQRDAALGLEELGARVGLSRNACWRRIKALEAEGVITGRVTLLDPERLDLGLSVVIQIRAARHDPAWLDEFARVMREMPEIQSAARMTGDLDYLIRARVADMRDYDRLYQRLIRRLDLSDVAASFVMEEIKDTTALPV